MQATIAERERRGEFISLEDFCSRLDSRIANRKILESLAKCGAFDFLGRDRAELVACVEETLAASAISHRDRAAGQVSLFGDLLPATRTQRAKETPRWSEPERMAFEKELLGFYVTGHPLDAYADFFVQQKYQTIASLAELDDRAPFRIAGAIVQVDKKFTKKEGKPFAVVWIEDLTATLEVVLWNETFVTVAHALEPGRVIAIQGTVDKRDDNVRATAKKVKLLSAENTMGAVNQTIELTDNFSNTGRAKVTENEPIVLRFSADASSEELHEVHTILATSPGLQSVILVFSNADGRLVQIDAGESCRVCVTPEIESKLTRWLCKTNGLQKNANAVAQPV